MTTVGTPGAVTGLALVVEDDAAGWTRDLGTVLLERDGMWQGVDINSLLVQDHIGKEKLIYNNGVLDTVYFCTEIETVFRPLACLIISHNIISLISYLNYLLQR